MKTVEALLANVRKDYVVREVLVGSFWTAVVIGSDPPRCGLASTLRPRSHPHGAPVSDAGDLIRRSAIELASLLRSSSTLEASIGMAAVNALLEVDEAAAVEANAEKLVVERATGLRLAVVGHFPFVDRIKRFPSECWVLELEPREGDQPAERAGQILPQADVVVITGTSLLNHTFDELIAQCSPQAFVMVVGPSAPLSPVMLDAGINAVCGTLVTNPDLVLRSVAEGATFRQVKQNGGVRLLTLKK